MCIMVMGITVAMVFEKLLEEPKKLVGRSVDGRMDRFNCCVEVRLTTNRSVDGQKGQLDQCLLVCLLVRPLFVDS